MIENKTRATQPEIVECVHHLLGPEVENFIGQATEILLTGDTKQGLDILRQLDYKIGGFGLHSLAGNTEAQIPYERALHRPIQYVQMILENSTPNNFTRFLTEMSCAHVEAILKKSARLTFSEKIRNESKSIPLGALLNKIQKLIPSSLYNDLSWLNRKVYIFVKHEYGEDVFADEFPEPETDIHLFTLYEATMIYFIARKLVVSLEQVTKAR